MTLWYFEKSSTHKEIERYLLVLSWDVPLLGILWCHKRRWDEVLCFCGRSKCHLEIQFRCLVQLCGLFVIDRNNICEKGHGIGNFFVNLHFYSTKKGKNIVNIYQNKVWTIVCFISVVTKYLFRTPFCVLCLYNVYNVKHERWINGKC